MSRAIKFDSYFNLYVATIRGDIHCATCQAQIFKFSTIREMIGGTLNAEWGLLTNYYGTLAPIGLIIDEAKNSFFTMILEEN